MAIKRLDPDTYPLDRNRQCRGDADRGSAFFRQGFKLGESPVDLHRCRYRIDREIGLGERHRLACRQRGGDAARRRSVVEIAEAALGCLTASVTTKRAPMKLTIPA